MDEPTWDSLSTRFRYCFEAKPSASYPPILERHAITPGVPFKITGAGGPIEVLPILQEHGEMTSLGFRVGGPHGGLCYSPDIVGIPEQSFELFQGLDMWIVDALRPMPHPAHFSLKQALGMIGKLQPKRALLTHMHIDLDYDTLVRELPAHVAPAYDGLTVDFDVG